MSTQRTIPTLATRTARFAAVALVGSTLALSGARAQRPGIPVPSPQSRELQQFDQQSRARLQGLLQSAARSARVAIDPGSFVYASRDDVLLVNAGIAGADSVEMGAFGRGVNVMFVFVRTPQSRIPPGFYTVRITGAPGAAKAAFVAADGRVAAEWPATVTETSATARGTPRMTLEIEKKACTLDWHGRRKDVVIRVEWENAPPEGP